MARKLQLVYTVLLSVLPDFGFPILAVELGAGVEADVDRIVLLQTQINYKRRDGQAVQRAEDGCGEGDPNCVPMMPDVSADAAPQAAPWPLPQASVDAPRALATPSAWALPPRAAREEELDFQAPSPRLPAAPEQLAQAWAAGGAAPAAVARPRLEMQEPEASRAAEEEDARAVDAAVDESSVQPRGGAAVVAPHCTPTCNWACDHPKCDEECTPTCKAPACETRCGEADLSGCKVSCDKPHCSIVCPKFISELGKRPCSTQCSEAMCTLKCDQRKQPCHNVCEQPQCEWKCKAPTACPTPKCKMVCQSPASCSGHATFEKLPALKPGEVAVQAFEAPPSLLQDAANRSLPSAKAPSTVRVPVRSLVQAEPEGKPEAREWQVELPLR